MNTVAIVGVGLIGGSFGLALREAGFTGDRIGVSSPTAIEGGIKLGAIDRSATLAEAAAAADCIYLAQPVDRIIETIEQLGPLARPHTIVTDAGSTKQAIVSKARGCLTHAHFIGGHPMAGKERSGVEAAQADLFWGRPYVLTPHMPSDAISDAFRSWLGRMGAQVIEMSAAEHDATVALSSHLPQIASTALALTLAGQGNESVLDVFGPGLLDMTRLAMSSPELWKPILETNRQAVIESLGAYKTALTDLQVALENDNVVGLFEVASAWARQLRQQGPAT